MKQKLDWPDLWQKGIAEKDNGGRWYAIHPAAKQYIDENGYRNPSRAWPYSHAKPLLTQKFARWLRKNYPEAADKWGLSQ